MNVQLPGQTTGYRKNNNKWLNFIIGLLAYPIGDLVGQLIIGDVNIARLVAVMLAGVVFYRLEVPQWFQFLDRVSFKSSNGIVGLVTYPCHDGLRRLNWIGKTAGAMLYFNPLWIARHVFIITCATTAWSDLNLVNALTQSLNVGLISFTTNLPISIVGNFVVQQCVSLRFRFLGSSLLTMLFNIKYAVEFRYFG